MRDRKEKIAKQDKVVETLQDRLLKECKRCDGNAASDIKNMSIALGVAMDKRFSLEYPPRP